jgi:uncharacterized protein (TIGR03643 family)
MDQITIDRIIEMAWEDRTPFEAIEVQFGYTESMVIQLMRNTLKRSSFNLWRKRVNSGVSEGARGSAAPAPSARGTHVVVRHGQAYALVHLKAPAGREHEHRGGLEGVL